MTESVLKGQRLLLAGAPPGSNAGNSVSTGVLLDALQLLGEVTVLSHRISMIPEWRSASDGRQNGVELGTQPVSVHAEALLAGFFHRKRLQSWQGGWAVNSRYAGALFAANVPYVIWEATTLRDELRSSSLRTVRRSGQGTGLGRTLHHAMLPVNDRLERMFYDRAAGVLAMSAYTRERIIDQHGIPPERVGVLTHPPSSAFLRALNGRAKEPVDIHQAPGTPWRLLFVGRADDPRKNFGLLIEAVHRLRSAGRQVNLTVVGPHTEHWRRGLALVGAPEAILFTGAVSIERLADAYLSHDVLLVPSHQEGFGIVVAEAFTAGLPVIATRCGGPEQIINESGAGILVEPNATAVAHALEVLLGNVERIQMMRARAIGYARSKLAFEPFAHAVACKTAELLNAKLTVHDDLTRLNGLRSDRIG